MQGGGIINRKFLSILLLLLTIALPLNVGAISAAATNQTNDNPNLNQAVQTIPEQNSTQISNKSTNNTTQVTVKNITSASSSNINYAAAGTAKTTTPVILTLTNINTAAAKLADIY